MPLDLKAGLASLTSDATRLTRLEAMFADFSTEMASRVAALEQEVLGDNKRRQNRFMANVAEAKRKLQAMFAGGDAAVLAAASAEADMRLAGDDEDTADDG